MYPLTGLASQWAAFQRSLAAMERIIELLEKPIDSEQLPTYSPTIKEVHSLQFDNLTFSYDEKEIYLRGLIYKFLTGK